MPVGEAECMHSHPPTPPQIFHFRVLGADVITPVPLLASCKFLKWMEHNFDFESRQGRKFNPLSLLCWCVYSRVWSPGFAHHSPIKVRHWNLVTNLDLLKTVSWKKATFLLFWIPQLIMVSCQNKHKAECEKKSYTWVLNGPYKLIHVPMHYGLAWYVNGTHVYFISMCRRERKQKAVPKLMWESFSNIKLFLWVWIRTIDN